MGALTPRLLLLLGLVTGLGSTPATAAREEPLTSVADIRYGVTLYHYYLDDYMSALTELLIAEQRGGIKGHEANPEIMEGGLAMGYGMERYASEIFDRLLEENRSVEARDAAWFYLANLRYTHGEWARTEEALGKISPDPVRTLKQDVVALRINAILKQDRPAEAAQILETNDVARRWIPYFYFNIGSAYARVGDYDRAVSYFSNFADAKFQREFQIGEQQALYDKAMTAAGFSFLFLKEYEQAKEYFSRVRLSSTLKNRALLGYGWAAVELGEYEEALTPWQYLAKSPLVDENNQEALIAVPYAYEKMGAEALSLQYYQRAEESFLTEIEKIDQVLATLSSEDLLGALKVEARGRVDWMAVAEEKQLSPRLTYLVRLFSNDRFQASIYELQDLLAIRDDLIEWQDKLAFYSDMIDTREEFRVEQAEFLKVSELRDRITDMQQRRADYEKQIGEIASQKDFFALTTEDEQELIKRAKRSLDNVEALRASDPFIDEYDEAARRYHGLLLWQASEKYSARLWQAIKNLNSLDKAIQQVSDVESRVALIMDSAPDLDPYRVKMDDASEKLLLLNFRVDDVIRNNEIDLRNKVAAVLQEQRVRLFNYVAQARLSVARIYDKARNQQLDAEFEQLKAEAEAAKKAKLEQEALDESKPKPSEFSAPSLDQLEQPESETEPGSDPASNDGDLVPNRDQSDVAPENEEGAAEGEGINEEATEDKLNESQQTEASSL